jgi:hypothetical protein
VAAADSSGDPAASRTHPASTPDPSLANPTSDPAASRTHPETTTGSSGDPAASRTSPASKEGLQEGHKKSTRDKREEKKKESEEERRQIELALWPTPETKKDISDAAGQDPDCSKLIRSARFRDMWYSFSRDPHPSSRMRSDLRKLAIDIMMTRTKREAKYASKSSKSTGTDDQSSKRKNRSLSLERGSTSSSGTLPKIPRVSHGTTPSNTTTSTPKIPTAVPEVMEEDDGDLVIDEEDEPGLADFAQDISDALPSYGNVASGKAVRNDFPYILYVHCGTEERRRMSKETWTLLMEKIQAASLELILSDKPAPKIEWSSFSKGVGVVAPIDEDSRAIVKTLVGDLTVEGQNFRAWAKGEKGEHIPLTIRIPATMTKEVFTAGKIMTAAVLLNKLPEKSYQIRSCEAINNSKNRLLKILAKKELVEAIIHLNGTLYVAASRLVVYYKREPLTKSSII